MNTFEEDLRATLRKQENALDGHTLARLGAARPRVPASSC